MINEVTEETDSENLSSGMEDIKDENKVDDIIDYIKLDYGNLINKNTLGNLFSCNVDK